jgi:hypothetical protein
MAATRDSFIITVTTFLWSSAVNLIAFVFLWNFFSLVTYAWIERQVLAKENLFHLADMIGQPIGHTLFRMIPSLSTQYIKLYVDIYIIILCIHSWGHTVVYLVETLCYKPEGHRFDYGWGHLVFQLTQSFQLHYGPGVDSAYSPSSHHNLHCINWAINMA